ncbi:MAG: ABC transporter permease [Deltaproteobacteria bacterium]|nr:ABC transporter permease [Deltaproteobacteria bacterium]
MPEPLTVEREPRSVRVHLHGDLALATARDVYARLQPIARRRGVRKVVVDFAHAGRIDSSGVAVIGLVRSWCARHDKQLELASLDDRQRAALEMLPPPAAVVRRTVEEQVVEPVTALEVVGERVAGVASAGRALVALVAATLRQGVLVATRRRRLPAGSVGSQIVAMGFDGMFIVTLLAFLLGITMGFQGVTQLQRLGAGVFVADMIGLSMVRELGPLIVAIILAGRTGAAIAAELGTMRVRSEIDALATMGIDPHRFLILPRLLAITVVGPGLTLIATFVGVFGGTLVASIALDMPMAAFWERIHERLAAGDFAHGLAKSLVFAWIIAIAGSHLGMRAEGDPTSVGQATTRAVVTSIFGIILFDAAFAVWGPG